MKKVIYLLAVVLFANACKNAPELLTSVSGKYQFEMLRDSIGDPIKPDEIVIIHLIGTDNNDSVWFDNEPMVIKKDTAAWNKGLQGIFEIFNDVSTGDSLRVTVPSSLFFEESVGAPAPPEAANVENFTFNIGILAVVDYEGYLEYMEKMTEDRLKEEMGNEYVSPEEQLSVDEKLIQDYMAENGIEAEKTEEGIYMAITTPGEGETANAGQTISANYTGYLLNKAIFDTSVREVAEENDMLNPQRTYGPFSFAVGQGQVIQGWDIAFQKLNKGAKATIIVPSHLAYGRNRMGQMIPPNSVLVFDVELLEIQ